jgi:hypothetical protein
VSHRDKKELKRLTRPEKESLIGMVTRTYIVFYIHQGTGNVIRTEAFLRLIGDSEIVYSSKTIP